MKTYIVYKHISPSNKVYIGITCQSPTRRWRNGNGYINNTYFYRAIQKYGWNNFQHIILYENLSLDEAKTYEEELIKEYKSTDNRFGYNKTDGGDCRLPCSEEFKNYLSEKFKGRYVSEETRKKISTSKTGVKRGPLPKEWKENISKSLMGNKFAVGMTANKIKVDMFTLSGEYIQSFPSAKEVGEFMQCDSSAINRVCRENEKGGDLSKTKYKGRYKGYIWKYDLSSIHTKRVFNYK